MKAIKVANTVRYENQRQFVKALAEVYGVSPLEFRRLFMSGSTAGVLT